MERARVIVYSAHESMCVPCREVEEFLSAHRVPFVRKDIAEDEEALEEFLEASKGGAPVPVIRIGGEVIFGFDRPTLAKALALDDGPAGP